MNRKTATFLLCAALLLLLLTGCGGKTAPVEPSPEPVLQTVPEPQREEAPAELSAEVQAQQTQSAVAAAGGIGVRGLTVPSGTEMTLTGRESGYYAAEKDGERYYVREYAVHPEKRRLPCKGTVVYDGTELFLTVLTEGEEVSALTRGKVLCLITVRGMTGTVPRWELRFSDDSPFESWTAYAKKGARIWWDGGMQIASEVLKENDALRVVGKTDRALLVTIDGRTGFVYPE